MGRDLLHFHVSPSSLWDIVSVFFVSPPRVYSLATRLWLGGGPDASSRAAACQNPTRGTLSVLWQAQGGGAACTH